MSSIPFAIVDRPGDGGRKPSGAFRELMERVAELPNDKAIEVPAKDAGPEKSFRASVCGAASRARVPVSIRKGDGVFYVMKKTDLTA